MPDRLGRKPASALTAAAFLCADNSLTSLLIGRNARPGRYSAPAGPRTPTSTRAARTMETISARSATDRLGQASMRVASPSSCESKTPHRAPPFVPLDGEPVEFTGKSHDCATPVRGTDRCPSEEQTPASLRFEDVLMHRKFEKLRRCHRDGEWDVPGGASGRSPASARLRCRVEQ